MSLRYTYTTMDRVFAKVERDLTSDFDEDAIVEWTGEALDFMKSAKSLEEVVCFLPVVNHQCNIPKYCDSIIQIAKDGMVNDVSAIALTATVNSVTNDPSYSNPTYQLLGEGESAVLVDKYAIVNIEYKMWVEGWYYGQRFHPVRLANHSFFNTLVCKETGFENIYCNSRDEYTIIDRKVLRFSFREGLVAIAYRRPALDTTTGWPMIPDTASHLTAIVKYIAVRMSNKDFFAKKQGSDSVVGKFEKDWEWYCKQASNIDKMPFGEDEHQDMMDSNLYLIPRQNAYQNFFGNLGTPENRHFDNPNSRRRYY